MTKFRIIIFGLLLALNFSACKEVKNSLPGSDSSSNTSSGVDELLIVMDENVAQSDIGQRLVAYVRDDYKIIPPNPERSEPKLNITVITGKEFLGEYKTYHNVLILGFMQDQGAASTLVKTALSTDEKQEAVEGTGDFLKIKPGEFTEGQVVVYMYANAIGDFMPYTEPYFDAMMAEFHDAALPYYRKQAYFAGENADASRSLFENFGASFKVPDGYVIALQNDSVALLRYDEGLYTIFVLMNESEISNPGEYFPNKGIDIRDQLGSEYVSFKGIEENYMLTDSTMGFVHRIIDMNGLPAYENRGLWRQEDGEGFPIGGGPFVNYYILDEASGRAFFLEGFVFAPGEKKRGQLRKLESVLRTFSTKPSA